MKLFIANYEKLNIPAEFDRYLSMLPDVSAERVEQKKQDRLKNLTLLREIMVQIVLSREAAGHYMDAGSAEVVKSREREREELYRAPLRFIKGEHGKPGLDPPCPNFDFNISHSGSMVILGCASGPIGVDVEKTERPSLKIDSIMKRFSENERRRIKRAVSPESEFYRIWTYREAFSKQTGIGLALFEREAVEIDYDSRSVLRDGVRLSFYEYSAPGYQIAVCAGSSENGPEIVMIDSL